MPRLWAAPGEARLMAWLDRRGKKWLLVWREDGTKHSKSYSSREEARIAKADLEKRLLTGTMGRAEDRKQPFGVYAQNLYEGDLSIRERTRETALTTLRLHLEPRLGRYTMEELQPARVRAVLAEIHREKGAWVAEAAHRVLTRVIRQAVTDGILHRNPLEGYGAPKTEKRPIRVLTPEEVGAVAEEMPDRLRMLVLMSAYGGFRIGELGALRREDLDFGARTVAVRRAVSTPHGKPEIGPPKTKSSERVVTLPAWLMQELGEHAVRHPGEYIFTREGGGLVTHNNVSYFFGKACRRAGVEPVPRFHDLRHTAVVILIRQGAHPKQIQARMGHSSITMTMDTYGHLWAGADAELAASLEGFKPEVGKVIEL